MRILNIESGYFVQHFRKLGHDVLSIGSSSGCDLVLDKPLAAHELVAVLNARGFVPDFVLWADGCRPPSVLGLELLPCPTIGFSIDQYCNPWHVPWAAAFDHMLLAQKDYLPLFRHSLFPRDQEWFPLYFDPREEDPIWDRDIPVSFVGTMSGSINAARKGFLDSFKALHPLVAISGAYRPVYWRSLLVLNQSAAGEVNYRTFEGAGCGALVVTEEAGNGLSELFIPGEELALYRRGDVTDAVRVCRELLAQPALLADMARAGRRRVMRDHTAAARAKRILALAEELLLRRSWQWRLAHRDLVRQELGKMFVFLGADPDLPIPEDMAAGYLRMSLSRL